MACNCGKSAPKVAMTSEAVTAMLSGSSIPQYKVTNPDGTERVHDLYIDAATDAARNGGNLTEVRG